MEAASAVCHRELGMEDRQPVGSILCSGHRHACQVVQVRDHVVLVPKEGCLVRGPTHGPSTVTSDQHNPVLRLATSCYIVI